MIDFNKIWCFGDSWGAGSELDFLSGEAPFSSLLAKKFNCELHNRAEPNMSLGLITRAIAQKSKTISKDDLVLVVIPPDSRWYTEWRTLDYFSSREFYIDKSDQWFQYHHQLFIFAICEMLDKRKCQYLLMHNYGKFPLSDSQYYFSLHHQDRFLNELSLTSMMTSTTTDSMLPIEVEKSQSNIFVGPYFKGCRCHPNQLGHRFIADQIEDKLRSMSRQNDQDKVLR